MSNTVEGRKEIGFILGFGFFDSLVGLLYQ